MTYNEMKGGNNLNNKCRSKLTINNKLILRRKQNAYGLQQYRKRDFKCP